MSTGPGVRRWGLAVDFGTTATAAATITGGQISALALDGAGRLSSSVYARADGVLLVGKQADNEAEYALDCYEPTPKRKISRPAVRLGGRQFAPVELIAAILARVLGEAVAQHNTSAPAAVVLTHPEAWTAVQCDVLAEATRMAGRRIGLAVPEPALVCEPVAAAQWYARDSHHEPPRPGQRVAVYDLGGGTFDVAVLERTPDGYTVLGRGGIDPLGGFDFDHRLLTYLGTKYVAPVDARYWESLQRPGSGDIEMGERRLRLQLRTRHAKEALSTETSWPVRLPGIDEPVLVTREDFETLIAADVDRTVEEMITVLDECSLSTTDLTAIYRVGGASRTPLVGRRLETLGVPVRTFDDAKLVVALGAAVMADGLGTPPAPHVSTPMPAAPPLDRAITPAPEPASPTPADRIPASRDLGGVAPGPAVVSSPTEVRTTSRQGDSRRKSSKRRRLSISLVLLAVLVAGGVLAMTIRGLGDGPREVSAADGQPGTTTSTSAPPADASPTPDVLGGPALFRSVAASDAALNAAQPGDCLTSNDLDVFWSVACGYAAPHFKVTQRTDELANCPVAAVAATNTSLILCLDLMPGSGP